MVVPNSSGPSRDELWQIYKLAIEDRNYQVTLNWDRTKHYCLLNFAAFFVATSLTHIAQDERVGIFGLVAFSSFFAAFSIWRGHTYYRASRKHLVAIERQLGLGEDLALRGTRGMERDLTGAKRSWRDAFTVVNLAIMLQLYIGFSAALACSFLCWPPRG